MKEHHIMFGSKQKCAYVDPVIIEGMPFHTWVKQAYACKDVAINEGASFHATVKHKTACTDMPAGKSGNLTSLEKSWSFHPNQYQSGKLGFSFPGRQQKTSGTYAGSQTLRTGSETWEL